MAITNHTSSSNEETVHAFKGVLKGGMGVQFPVVSLIDNPAVGFRGTTVENELDGLLYKSNGTIWVKVASGSTPQASLNIRFKIGDGGAETPSVGDTTSTHAALVGKSIDDFAVFRSGTFIYPNDEYTFDSLTGTITYSNQWADLETALIK